MGARPSPVHGRRQPHEVGSDEGFSRLVGTSQEPSSDPCFARAAFSRKWEKERAGLNLPSTSLPSRATPHAKIPFGARRALLRHLRQPARPCASRRQQDRRRRHRLHDRRDRAGADDDAAGARAVLLRHGPEEEHPRDDGAEPCRDRAGVDPVGAARLQPGVFRRRRLPRRFRAHRLDGRWRSRRSVRSPRPFPKYCSWPIR